MSLVSMGKKLCGYAYDFKHNTQETINEYNEQINKSWQPNHSFLGDFVDEIGIVDVIRDFTCEKYKYFGKEFTNENIKELLKNGYLYVSSLDGDIIYWLCKNEKEQELLSIVQKMGYNMMLYFTVKNEGHTNGFTYLFTNKMVSVLEKIFLIGFNYKSLQKDIFKECVSISIRFFSNFYDMCLYANIPDIINKMSSNEEYVNKFKNMLVIKDDDVPMLFELLEQTLVIKDDDGLTWFDWVNKYLAIEDDGVALLDWIRENFSVGDCCEVKKFLALKDGDGVTMYDWLKKRIESV